MDFRQTTQPASNRPAQQQPAPTGNNTKRTGSKGINVRWFSVLNLVVLVGVAVIVALVAIIFARSGSNSTDFKYVSKKQYQAVFLNNGQVYFGHVNNLSDKYVRLNDIYYLTQQSTSDGAANSSSNGSYSLVKLGCQQIHYPTDQMVINRDQVTFWENLQDKGQVVTKINEFKKQNPNGPDCSQVSSQTQATSTNGATQGATGTGQSTSSGTTTTNGSTTTTNK